MKLFRRVGSGQLRSDACKKMLCWRGMPWMESVEWVKREEKRGTGDGGPLGGRSGKAGALADRTCASQAAAV